MVDALAVQDRIRSGEVDELEEAELRIHHVVVEGPHRPATCLVDHHDLARIQLADHVGADHVQGGRLRGQYPAAVEASEAERPKAVRIAHPDYPLVVGQHQGEGTLQAGQHLGQRLVEGLAWVHVATRRQHQGQQLGHQVAVRGNGPRQHPGIGCQLLGVDQVAVVAEGELEVLGAPVHGLGISPGARPGGRIARLAYCQVAGEGHQGALVEDVGDQAHVLDHREGLTVADRHARRFLAAVLQGVEAQIGQVGDRHARGENPEDTTGLLGRVVVRVHTDDIRSGHRDGHRFVVPAPRASGSRPV